MYLNNYDYNTDYSQYNIKLLDGQIGTTIEYLLPKDNEKDNTISIMLGCLRTEKAINLRIGARKTLEFIQNLKRT
jgi:hypothetical protein